MAPLDVRDVQLLLFVHHAGLLSLNLRTGRRLGVSDVGQRAGVAFFNLALGPKLFQSPRSRASRGDFPHEIHDVDSDQFAILIPSTC